MFEKIRQRRAEKLMQELDDTPVTEATVKQRNKLVERLGDNGVVMSGEEYTTPQGEVLRPVNRPGTKRGQTRGNFRR